MSLTERAKRTSEGGELQQVDDGLPVGARRFDDPEVAHLLGEAHGQEVDLYNDTNICVNAGLIEDTQIRGLEDFELEVSGFNSRTFKGKLHPRVGGYNWYRGIAVKVNRSRLPCLDQNQVIIFSGFMQPRLKDGAPEPVVYTRGRVSREAVLEVVQSYTTGIISYINEVRSGTISSQE